MASMPTRISVCTESGLSTMTSRRTGGGGSIGLIAGKISALTNNNATVDGFYIAEIILVSLIFLFVGVTLYPASEAVVPLHYQRNTALRAISMSVNVVVGALLIIYFCFSIYGVHAAYNPPSEPGANVRMRLSLLILPTTSLLLLSTLGAFSAIARGLRSHMIPSIVIGTASLTLFFEATQPYVEYLNNFTTKDWRDDAYVGMFVLNWLSLAGLAVFVPLGVAFTYY